VDDSDSWLEVSPDELDGMLMRASGKGKQPSEAEADADGVAAEEKSTSKKAKAELGDEHGVALQDLAKKVQDFVGGQGDMEGARFAE
jgi:hypothetical protein